MALKFISGNARVLLGRVPEIEGVAAFTLSVWVRLDGVSADAAIAVRGSAFNETCPWALYRDDVASVSGRQNTLAAHVRTNVGLLRIEAASNAMNDTAWHHVALVFEAGVAAGVRMYIDGVVDPYSASTIGHANVVADTSNVQWGFNQSNVQFLGAMADAAICNVALDADDIARLAKGFSPLAVTGSRSHLVVYHDFLRGPNRPGIGPLATTGGVLSAVAHPAIRFPTSLTAHVSNAHSPIALPWHTKLGVSLANAAAAGELFIPGAARGAVHPSGEVHP